MAIWQYNFYVITRESYVSLYPQSGEDSFEVELYWLHRPVDKSLFIPIKYILEETKSWSTEIDQYGNLQSNCFEVFFNLNNIVEVVSFRIDFTSNYEYILNMIVEFCILNGLVILDQEFKFIELNVETLQQCIKSAPQVSVYENLKDKKFNK